MLHFIRLDLHAAVVDASQRQTSDQCEIASDKNANRQAMSA
jgi:hypothetical protein